MTKEGLEKEAEENSFRYTLDKPWVCEVERKQIMAHFEKGYLAGAEPREKRIAELEAQIEKMKCLLNEIYSEYGFSELVQIRNNLPIEIQEVIKEIKEK